MKSSPLFIITVVLCTVISGSIIAQPVRDGVELNPDTTTITLQELTNPSFTNLLVPITEKPNNSFVPSSKPVRLNTATKLFLKIGTGILRASQTNGDGDIHLYSLENAWKYPGKTVRYPESLSEYEGFLERYSRFTIDN